MADTLLEIMLIGARVVFRKNPGGNPIVDGYEICGYDKGQVIRREGNKAYKRVRPGEWVLIGEWDHEPTLEEIGGYATAAQTKQMTSEEWEQELKNA